MVISLNLTELIEQDPHATALVGLEMFDLIIVDDLQMVRHSYEWQEGLFHLINRLREHQNRFYIWQMIQHGATNWIIGFTYSAIASPHADFAR